MELTRQRAPHSLSTSFADHDADLESGRRRAISADRIYGAPPNIASLILEGPRIVGWGDRRYADNWVARHSDHHDHGDATIFPGFVDAHAHPVQGARFARGLDLTAVTDTTELAATLARRAAELQQSEWLLGWGLKHSLWGDSVAHNEVLETTLPGVPILLRMFDAHSAIASTAAMDAAGIRGPGRLGAAGEAVGDDTGRLTGLLLEAEAVETVARHVPAETPTALRARLSRTLRAMAESGLTGMHVMDFEDDPSTLYTSLDEGGLPLRLRVYPWVTPGSGESHWSMMAAHIGAGGRRWRQHGVKVFLDGTIDNGTAWLASPDARGESNHGLWDPSEYRRMLAFFAERGIGTATHAIGDTAVRTAADTIRRSLSQHPAVRHRIEHLELLDERTLRDVVNSGAVVSMQPTHCTDFVRADGDDNWSRRVGDSRRRNAWRLGSVTSAGVHLALGSDWPVADFPPLGVIAAAMLRRAPGNPGVDPIGLREGLSFEDAIAGYTTAAAYAAGVEGSEGALLPGYVADVTVLRGDPARSEPDSLVSTPVAATYIDAERIV